MQNYNSLLHRQKSFFRTNQTKSLSFRLDALRKLRQAIIRYEQELLRALKEDLHKSEFEAYTTEIGILLEEIRFTSKHLPAWVKPRKVKTPFTHIGSKSYIYPEPYGVALILSPWNYPFQLAVSPLIGAIAAGNCAVIKPSELTPSTSGVLAKLIAETFPEEFISVVQGGIETSQALINERFDYLFFTGSVSVGKLIMEAAAKHLTPVTLELGGKSPCIVHADANLKLAAKRMVWGKFINAGQTCVAPDYLYVHKQIKDEFLRHVKNAIRELYGEDVIGSGTFSRIISERHFNRLCSLLNDGTILIGGKTDKANLLLEPTVVDGITWDHNVMQEEIFGPILPVLEYTDLSQVVAEIQDRPKPLALYIFSDNKKVQTHIIDSISFGGGCINDTLFHVSSPYLPFGGVGESGIGAYHGKGSFDTFSHEKSILKQTTLFDIRLRYPNRKNALKKIKWFFK